MDHDKQILVLTASLLAFTVATLCAAIYRKAYLERHGKGEADYQDLRLFANDQIINESFRVLKHGLIVGAVLFAVRQMAMFDGTLTQPGLSIVHVLLNVLAGVGFLMGVNSAWMLHRRRRRFLHFIRTRT